MAKKTFKPDDVKSALLHRPSAKKPLGLSTGSTLVNLAFSGNPDYGLETGKYYFEVGDTNSGKTLLWLTCLAEASVNPAFKGYRLIFDDGEEGALMDFMKFFGPALAGKMEPASKRGPSRTVEELYYNVDDAVRAGKPFVYVLDSENSLSSEEEGSKFLELKAAHRRGKDAAGSYGDGKAKKNSAGIRQVLPGLRDTGSILVVISQTRDNLGWNAPYQPKVRSGGRALSFYATVEAWSSVKTVLKKRVRGKERSVGILAKVDVKRSRITGRACSVEVPIYWSSGIDDVGSMVAWMVEEKGWKKEGDAIIVPEWGVRLGEEELIAFVEEGELEADLRAKVAEEWKEIEAACAVRRKPRYA